MNAAVDFIPKSPLRYPGGKSRAVNTLLGFIPKGLTTLCSPFFGGGSVELACAARGMQVHGYDNFKPLVAFWQMLLNNPAQLAAAVKRYYPLSREGFYDLQRTFMAHTQPEQQAAMFYVLNRASFSGTTLSGGMSPNHPRFTRHGSASLAAFSAPHVSVERADFRHSLKQHAGDFLYLDPPYANGGALYGERGDMHKGFPHHELADILRQRGGWILSYNNCALIRELYEGYTMVTPAWAYGMSSNKQSKELLILSHDISVAAAS